MEKVKLSINNTKENKLPSNIEAEQSLIGSVLVNNDIIDAQFYFFHLEDNR